MLKDISNLDPFSLLMFGAVLYVGSRFVEFRETAALSRWIAGVSFLTGLLAWVIVDGGLYYFPRRAMHAAGTALCVNAVCTVILPIIRGMHAIIRRRLLAPISTSLAIGRQRKLRKDHEKRQRLHAEAERRESERSRPDRERLAHEAAEEQQRTAQLKHDAQQRRDRARFATRLLFDRHAAEIKDSLPRKRFDEYVCNDLSDDRPPDEVEARAEQIQNVILDFFESQEADQRQRTREEVLLYYETQYRLIEAASFDGTTKQAMKADLHLQEDKELRGLPSR